MPRRHIIDLANIQSRLDELCDKRLWPGLTPKEHAEYQDLLGKEAELLDLRERVDQR